MDRDLQLKLQAFHDGELSAHDARTVEQLLAEDAEAQALLTELEATKGALAGFDELVKIPESRDFFWSKIQRTIQARELTLASSPALSLLSSWRRFLLPVSAVAALILVGLFSAIELDLSGPWRGPEVEASVADPGAFTYRDYAARTTLVWLSYPAENEYVDDELSDWP